MAVRRRRGRAVRRQPDSGAGAAGHVRGDGAATLVASGDFFLRLERADGLTLPLNAEQPKRGTAFTAFQPDLDRRKRRVQAQVRPRLRVAPWHRVAVRRSRTTITASAIRDGRPHRSAREVGQALQRAFDASVGAVYDRRFARNDQPVVPGISGRVFDLRGKAHSCAPVRVTEQLQAGARLLGAPRRRRVDDAAAPGHLSRVGCHCRRPDVRRPTSSRTGCAARPPAAPRDVELGAFRSFVAEFSLRRRAHRPRTTASTTWPARHVVLPSLLRSSSPCTQTC